MGRPNQTNAADPAQVKAAAREARQKDGQEIQDYRAVLAIPEGRRLLAGVLALCKLGQLPWTASAEIHRNAGIMEVGNHIFRRIVKADQAIASQMLIERYQDDLEGEINV